MKDGSGGPVCWLVRFWTDAKAIPHGDQGDHGQDGRRRNVLATVVPLPGRDEEHAEDADVGEKMTGIRCEKERVAARRADQLDCRREHGDCQRDEDAAGRDVSVCGGVRHGGTVGFNRTTDKVRAAREGQALTARQTSATSRAGQKAAAPGSSSRLRPWASSP